MKYMTNAYDLAKQSGNWRNQRTKIIYRNKQL